GGGGGGGGGAGGATGAAIGGGAGGGGGAAAIFGTANGAVSWLHCGEGAASAGLSCCASTLTGNTVRHTEHRARTPAAGTFAGSMRNTVEQVGQVAFIGSTFLGRHR